ncbi:hydroxymethylbilane synthase [Archaeoglobus sulfaticallidus PM70-1]|uniref:Probable porphobilinogen deaminase n=1 Tax=Archaeoglobus sulfaticallidus PM70-1 TaxID=387631 RepID=N0BC73_9EURY|nr:hydroxymethylbilane synthase [Archaeoglobus sulfaticallidus]AGK60583.1 hydroxymethylbilane synthase [Archaeoglobus sulfaticallidus PM70-1]
MSEKVVVGTRGSKLALAQTNKVVERLRDQYEVEIRIIKTKGDIMKDKPLYAFKGSGAFVRAIDEALANSEIDIAVHSLKDVPVERVEGTVISAYLERESPYDAFISKDGSRLEEMEYGAVIGTSSLRRAAQLRRFREDLVIKNIRGNLDTRLRKLGDGYDGIIVAEAGLIRLSLDIDYQRLDSESFIPSANQGIIAVATREGEESLVSFMNHENTMLSAIAEREVLKVLGIGCTVPAGILAETDGSSMKVTCEILEPDGKEVLKMSEEFSFDGLKEVIKKARKFAEAVKDGYG